MLDDEGGIDRLKPVRRSAEERAAIVSETYNPGATVAGVARKHGVSPTRLSTWRTQAKRKSAQQTSGFAEVVVTSEPAFVSHDGVEIITGSVSIRLPKSTTPKRIADIARHLGRQG